MEAYNISSKRIVEGIVPIPLLGRWIGILSACPACILQRLLFPPANVPARGQAWRSGDQEEIGDNYGLKRELLSVPEIYLNNSRWVCRNS